MTTVFKTLRFKIFEPRIGKADAFDELLEENTKGVMHCFSVAKGHDIDDKELLNHFVYSNNSEYPLQNACSLPSAIRQTVRDKALEIFKSHKRRCGRMPEFSQVPVVLDRRTLTLKKLEGALPWFAGITTNRGKKYVPLHVMRQHRYPACLLPKIISGELPMVKAELLKKGSEFWIHIIVRIEKERENPGKPRAIIGIDLGEKRLATCASLRLGQPLTRNDIRFFPNARSIRYRFSRARAWLQSKGRTKELERMGHREKRASMHLNHYIAAQIKKLAQDLIQQGYEVEVVIGNLRNIRSSFKGSRSLKRRLHSWPFFQLRNFIKYKCEEAGAVVKFISEKNTSITCHRCGSKGERASQSLFVCECGQWNADLNAAINIANMAQRRSGERTSGNAECSGVVSDRPTWKCLQSSCSFA